MDHPLLQPAIALCFVYCGILMGIGYGLLNDFRTSLQKKFFQDLTDVVCSAFLCGLFCYTLFITTGGTIRFYPFLMSFIGFWLEQKTIHAVVLSIRSKRIHKSASHSS